MKKRIDSNHFIVYNIIRKWETTSPNDERKVSTMCQPTTTITAKVEELMNLKKLAQDLQNQMEAITDEIKAFMGDEETMMAGSYKVTWKETVSRRVDTAALKKVLGDALDEYTKTITTRPFKII